MQKVKHTPKCDSVITIKPLEQSNIAVAFPSLEFGADNYMSLLALNSAFGGGMSSRLFQEVREKSGLAYNVYSYPSAYFGDATTEITILPALYFSATYFFKSSVLKLKTADLGMKSWLE